MFFAAAAVVRTRCVCVASYLSFVFFGVSVCVYIGIFTLYLNIYERRQIHFANAYTLAACVPCGVSAISNGFTKKKNISFAKRSVYLGQNRKRKEKKVNGNSNNKYD